jgi:hypothetical protein
MPSSGLISQQNEASFITRSSPPPASSPATSPAHVWKKSRALITFPRPSLRAEGRRTFSFAQIPPEHRRRQSLAATSPELVGNLASPVRILFLAQTPSDQDPKDQDSSLTRIGIARSEPSRSHKIQRPGMLILPNRYGRVRTRRVSSPDSNRNQIDFQITDLAQIL